MQCISSTVLPLLLPSTQPAAAQTLGAASRIALGAPPSSPSFGTFCCSGLAAYMQYHLHSPTVRIPFLDLLGTHDRYIEYSKQLPPEVDLRFSSIRRVCKRPGVQACFFIILEETAIHNTLFERRPAVCIAANRISCSAGSSWHFAESVIAVRTTQRLCRCPKPAVRNHGNHAAATTTTIASI